MLSQDEDDEMKNTLRLWRIHSYAVHFPPSNEYHHTRSVVMWVPNKIYLFLVRPYSIYIIMFIVCICIRTQPTKILLNGTMERMLVVYLLRSFRFLSVSIFFRLWYIDKQVKINTWINRTDTLPSWLPIGSSKNRDVVLVDDFFSFFFLTMNYGWRKTDIRQFRQYCGSLKYWNYIGSIMSIILTMKKWVTPFVQTTAENEKITKSLREERPSWRSIATTQKR